MKFANPLGKGKTIWISQTYHGKYNQAIDIGNLKEGDPLFPLGNGTISTVGSDYCILNLEGSKLRTWYTHCKNLPKKGQVFKVGQKVCEVGKSSAIHLHLGLTWLDGHSPRPNIMDYMDRKITFATKYADIMKSWFTSSEKINWKLHKDLSYITNKPEEPVEPPQQSECEKLVNILQDSLDSLTADYRALQGQVGTLQADRDLARAEVVELGKGLDNLQKKYDILHIDKNRVENDLQKAVALLNSQLSRFSAGELLSELLLRFFKGKRS